MAVTVAARVRPRTCSASLALSSAAAGSAYPMAMATPRLGAKLPEVTTPI